MGASAETLERVAQRVRGAERVAFVSEPQANRAATKS
jgi:hypothetical protein